MSARRRRCSTPTSGRTASRSPTAPAQSSRSCVATRRRRAASSPRPAAGSCGATSSTGRRCSRWASARRPTSPIEARAYDQEELAAAARATAVELLGADDVPGSLKWYRFEEPVEAPAPPETLAHRLVGDGELARLDADPRPDLWEQAAARWEALRFPYQAAYARFRQAEAILAAGGARADAATALQTAHAACVQLGAAPLRDEIEALARRARLPLTADHRHDARSGRSGSPSAS